MFCRRCGLGIPDDVSLCWACGAQQTSVRLCVRCDTILPPDAPDCLACGAVQGPTTWEYCEIRVESGLLEAEAIDVLLGKPPYTDQFRFCADGAGPAGVYSVGCSEWAEGSTPTEWDRGLFERFVEELRLRGWQPLSREGGEWWAQRFRRATNPVTRGSTPPAPGAA